MATNLREQLTERVGKPHLSYSSLKYALGDMKLWEMYMRGQLKKESEALTFGKRYKEWKAEQIQKHSSKELASQEDWKKAKEMIQRLKDCGLYDKRFAGGKYQVEFNVDIDGVPLKGFLDCLQDDSIIDSKSSRSIDKFRWDVNSFSYDIQAYVYTKVFDIKDFYWVVQEKAFPFYPADVKCSDETLFKGEMKFHEALENIKNWLQDDTPTEKHYAEFIV